MPERAALAEWGAHPPAHAQVVRFEKVDQEHAIVVTDTLPSRPMRDDCLRTSEGWVFGIDQLMTRWPG